MKSLLKFLTILAAVAISSDAHGQTGPNRDELQGDEKNSTTPIKLEFVQQGKSMSFADNKLTLKDVPTTLFFSDRPERITGHMTTKKFVELWSESQDSFKSDPPNAAVAVVGDTDSPPAIVELVSVSQNGSDLVYGVKVLEGELPASAATGVTVFIDPWVWRRPYWRAGYLRGPRGGYCHYSYYLGHGVCRW